MLQVDQEMLEPQTGKAKEHDQKLGPDTNGQPEPGGTGAMQQIPAPLPALPAPIIIHPNQFKLGLEGTEDRMEKYRT